MGTNLRPCPACGRPMDANRKVCVFCQQSGVQPPPAVSTPAASPAPPKADGSRVQSIILNVVCGVFVMLLVGAWLLVKLNTRPEQPGVSSANTKYELRISAVGKWSGAYMVVKDDGTSTSQSVDGEGDRTFSIGEASIVSASFQKKGDDDYHLTVSIYRGGERVNEAATNAAYGVATTSAK